MGQVVGRDYELELLRALLRDAQSGRGRAVLILGEAGIGKTSLSEALASTAKDAGFRVAWGRCTDGEPPAYWPWRQILRALGGSRSDAFAATDGMTAREALFASVASELEEATIAGPTLVVLEDIHWADASSLALLRFIVGVVPDLPLLLALTTRDDALELSAVASDTLRELPPAVHRVALGGLDQGSTDIIVERLWPNAPTQFMTEVHQRTGGNPFFVQEVATLRRLQGERAGLTLPPGVAQVLGRRLARLSQATQAVLGIGSVIGDEIDMDLMALAAGRAVEEVRQLLDEAVRSRLVVRNDEVLAFAHPLVRETLYESLPHAVRANLHGKVAHALEVHNARGRLAAGDLDAQLAAHWRRATGDAARRRAAEHGLAAARGAMHRTAYEQAVRYYRWALDAATDNRLSILLELGEALVFAGELTQGRAALTEAGAQAISVERGDELARAVLAMGGGLGGFEVEVGDAGQIGLLENALALLPAADSSLRAGVLARLSVTINDRGAAVRRIELAREAIGMAQRVVDTRTEVAALAAYCDAISGPDYVRERLAAADRMLELTGVASDPKLSLLAHRIRLLALLELGEFGLVDAEIATYAAIAEQLRLSLYLWPVPIWRGMRALMQGDLELAWQYSDEAEELGHRAQSWNAQLMVFTLRSAYALATDRRDIMVGLVRRANEVAGMDPVGACAIGAMAFDADPTLSKRLFERARANGVTRLPDDAEWLEGVWHYGELGIRYVDRAMTQDAYDALVPYADLWVIDGIGGACFGVAAHQLGRLAAMLGRRHDAERWLRRALEHHRDARAGLLVARTERVLADLGMAPPSQPERPESNQGKLRRDGRIWHLEWQGQAATVPDSKGMRDLATLVAVPGRELHVLDLIEAAGGPAARVDDGHAGPMLDWEARDAYRTRLGELEDDLVEAERNTDIGRVAALREERDFLAAELAAAVGLGGRERLAGDRHERARKAVAMRIGTAIRAIAEVHPTLGRHLRHSVATGRFCVYRPERHVTWRL